MNKQNDIDMSSNKNIPQLRFPEFTGEWEEKRFSELYEKHNVKNDLSFGVDKIISVANMYYKTDANVGDEDYLKTYNIFRIGDIAFEGNKNANFAFGRFVENTIGDGIVSHVFDVYSPISPNHCIDYWKYAINYERIMRPVLEKSTIKSTMMTNLIGKDFLKQSILVPSPAEQQKIAECLSEIDDLIAAQSEKVDALKERKKGMMQQMFPKQGETTPRLRFPGYEGIWKEIELGKVADFQNGYAYNSSTFSKEGNYVIRISDIQDGVISLSTAVRSACVVPEVFKINKGDILIAMSGATTGKIGEYQSDDIAYINQRVGNIKPFDINRKLLLFLLQSDFFTRYLNSILTVGAQPNISSKQICSFRFMLPPTESEQHKIAECLSAIDGMIASESAKLDALKDHMKGLMQQLFPQPKK